MNKKTILQELYKKIARMDSKAFEQLVVDLWHHYNKTHNETIDDLRLVRRNNVEVD